VLRGVVIAFLLVTTAAMGCPAASAATTVAPQPTLSAGVVLTSGTVTNGGRPVAHATVAVFAAPTSAALVAAGERGRRLLPLGSASTSSAGRFTVTGSLDRLPDSYRGPAGVDLQIVVSDTTHSVTWVRTLTGSQAGRSERLDVDLARGVVAGGSGPAGLVAVADPPTGLLAYAREYLAADAASRTRLLGAVRPLTADASSRPGVPDPAGCGLVYWLASMKTNVQEHYVNVYSFSGAPVTLTEGVSNASTQTLGVAVQSSGGSLSLGGTQSITFSVEASQSGLWDEAVSNRVNYRQQGVTCQTMTYWRPYSLYDFITDLSPLPHANFAYCQYHASGYSFATSSATNVTYSAGVTLPGLSLSAQSGYGTSQRLTYSFHTAGYLCGNAQSGPASSSQVSAHA
jgi:hypothetical protein